MDPKPKKKPEKVERVDRAGTPEPLDIVRRLKRDIAEIGSDLKDDGKPKTYREG